ncbi:hypothetical protein DFH08DRAFT_899568 [Mycena albidolilacea]|uniref:Uncharacterized protein n=1 Tax=Mycena albidolilacea TaxID=1033008 RepID=A0AAD7EBB0_9AGAR|nr:hypothetical protein DFH08DRAFT_899568 [Mycena albidolilacea]
MITDENPSPPCPSHPRFDPRAARAHRFHAIRSQRPMLTSRAACARYRIGSRSIRAHIALSKRLDCIEKRLQQLNTRLLLFLDFTTLIPFAALTSIAHDIHDIQRASSLCRARAAANCTHTLHEILSLSSTLLHAPLKLAPPPAAPSSSLISMDFFDG